MPEIKSYRDLEVWQRGIDLIDVGALLKEAASVGKMLHGLGRSLLRRC